MAVINGGAREITALQHCSRDGVLGVKASALRRAAKAPDEWKELYFSIGCA